MFFLEMLKRTIPRSWRAAGALLVVFITLPRGFSALESWLVPGTVSGGDFVGVAALVVALIATIAFYYFQAVDGQPQKYDSLKTLDTYYQKEAYKKSTATPVFTSHDGGVGDDSHKKQKT